MYLDLFLVLIALVLSVYLLKKRVNVGIVMVLDSVFIVIIAKMPANEALKYAFIGAVSDKTIKLILALFLIMMLENIMRNTGRIKVVVESLKELVGDNRYAAALLPTVLGLLPSPGGARFSCPMVEGIIEKRSSDENKAFVNYWFRHVWMDGFILYPGIIVAAELLNVSVITLFFHIFPFMLLNVALGAILSFKYVKKEKIKATKPKLHSFKEFTIGLLPIVLVILIYIVLIPYTGYSLEIACALVVVALMVLNKYDLKKILETAKEAFPVKLVAIIIGVMIFKEVLLNSGAMEGIPALMEKYSIPIIALFIALPFLGGLSSGITVSYVSMTFPILIPLGLGDNLWYPTLAFVAGSAGCMITPLHLCAVMTVEYFNSSLMKMLKKVAFGQVILVSIVTLLVTFIL